MGLRYGYTFYLPICLLFLAPACATSWKTQPAVNPWIVKRALNDTAEIPRQAAQPEVIPDFKAPSSLRPCCVFGMDLKVKVGAAPVPGYAIENIVGINEVGPHGYDKGTLKSEHNGLVYTCRGGFIDLAHIRDNADRTLYLAMQVARQLPAGFTITLPVEATERRVVVKPIPPEIMAQYGRWELATMIAQWANFQFSVWHEIATWYDYEEVKGFSEKLSAFSLEDLYSNVLGEKLAAGIIMNHEETSRAAYDHAMDAWIHEGLRRLGGVSRTDGRRAMQAVDGVWWDSTQRVPENKLVLRRFTNLKSPLQGWLVEWALKSGPKLDELKAMCKGEPGPLALSVPEQLGKSPIEEYVTTEYTFNGSWMPKEFPVPVEKGKTITQADFPKIMADIKVRGEKELGEGFDQSGPASVPIPLK